MRHLKYDIKLGRNSSHRKALLDNLTTSLLQYEKITTTVVKAKELKRVAEKVMSIAKRGATSAHKNVFKTVRDKEVVKKLFSSIVPRIQTRNGGYTRVVRIGNRPGDNAPMAVIELVDRSPEIVAEPKKQEKGVKAEDKKQGKAEGKKKANSKVKVKAEGKKKEAAAGAPAK